MFNPLVNARVLLRSPKDKIAICAGTTCHVPFILMDKIWDTDRQYCPACRSTIDEAFEDDSNDKDHPSDC